MPKKNNNSIIKKNCRGGKIEDMEDIEDIKVLIDEQTLRNRVQEIAEQIMKDYKG